MLKRCFWGTLQVRPRHPMLNTNQQGVDPSIARSFGAQYGTGQNTGAGNAFQLGGMLHFGSSCASDFVLQCTINQVTCACRRYAGLQCSARRVWAARRATWGQVTIFAAFCLAVQHKASSIDSTHATVLLWSHPIPPAMFLQ